MAPRKPKNTRPAPPFRTLVLDNGGYTIKAGYVTDEATDEPTLIPNCIARDADRNVYVGSELDRCKDFSEMAFRRPVEKGFIVNWEAEKEIWDRQFFDDGCPQPCGDTAETRLLLTEPVNGLPVLQTNCDQMVFEEFGFASYCRVPAPALGAYHDVQAVFGTPRDPATVTPLPAEAVLLVDSGYSHTTVAPLLHGRPLHSAVRRLDVGGKLLTNYLTRLLSLRHYDMRNDPYIVNEIKEQACYVSLDFARDLDRTWKGPRGGPPRPDYRSGAGIAKDYVLPDFHTRARGVVRDYDPAAALGGARARKLAAATGGEAGGGGIGGEDVLTLRNERFTVPELLFHPADVGLRQSGLATLVLDALRAVPVGLWPALLANVVVVGGNALFDGFVPRLQTDLVALVPDACVVRVARPADPLTHTWRGGANFARHPHSHALAVTKQEYDEHGAAWVARKFATGAAEP